MVNRSARLPASAITITTELNMFSDLVQSLACACKRLATAGFTRIGGLFALLALSTSAQANWQDPLNTPAFETQRAHQTLMLDVVRADRRLIAAGSHGHIVLSDDDGHTWKQARVPVSVTLTSLHFPSGQIGWAAGHDGVILRTDDGGQSWTKQFDGFIANKAIVAAAEKMQQAAEQALADAEARGDDVAVEEATMALENAEFAVSDASYDMNSGSTKPFLDVWFYDARRGFAVGAYGMLFETRDGGENWVDASSRLPNPDRLHLNAITSVGGRSLMIVGEMGLIMRSDDLGENWTVLDSPYDGSLFGLVADRDQQLLFGLRGHVFRSTDGGISWMEMNTGSEQTLLSGAISSRRTLLVGNAGSVVMFDAQMQQPRALIIEGRKAYAAVAEASDGNFVLVGEAGVMRLNAAGELIDQAISMAAGDF